MAAELIGKVKAERTFKIYEVKWDSTDRSVYVSYAGWTKAGNAGSASHAMNIAQAWLHDK